jgi:hypothetical protein
MSFFLQPTRTYALPFLYTKNLLDQTQIYVFLFDSQRKNKKKISKTDVNVNLY